MAFEGKKLDLSKIASGVRGTKEASDLVDILEGHFDEIRAQVDLQTDEEIDELIDYFN